MRVANLLFGLTLLAAGVIFLLLGFAEAVTGNILGAILLLPVGAAFTWMSGSLITGAFKSAPVRHR